jgi:hypothetical protein
MDRQAKDTPEMGRQCSMAVSINRPLSGHMTYMAMELVKRVRKPGAKTSAKLTGGEGIFGQSEDTMACHDN